MVNFAWLFVAFALGMFFKEFVLMMIEKLKKKND